MFEPARRDDEKESRVGADAKPVDQQSVDYSTSGTDEGQHDPEKTGVVSVPAEVAVDGGTEEVIAEADEPPEPPYSTFTNAQKIMITLTVSFLAIISPLSGQIYLPALDQLATDLHVPISYINLTITTFMVCRKHCSPPEAKPPQGLT